MTSSKRWETWRQSVREALELLGGSAHLSDLYEKVREVRVAKGVPLNSTYPFTIRRTLQDGEEFFRDGTHRGTWHLRRPSPKPPSDTK